MFSDPNHRHSSRSVEAVVKESNFDMEEASLWRPFGVCGVCLLPLFDLICPFALRVFSEESSSENGHLCFPKKAIL